MKYLALFSFIFTIFNVSISYAENFHQYLPETAKLINKQLPVMIDETTELYAVEVIGKSTLLYKNKLIDGKRSEAISETKFSNLMRPIHINYIQSNPAMIQAIKSGITYQYGYYFADGSHYTTLSYDQNNFK